MALLEETLRPIKNVGWNIAVGVERVYKERFNNKKFNIENELIDERLLAQKLILLIRNLPKYNFL